jgi:hypothetical protein
LEEEVVVEEEREEQEHEHVNDTIIGSDAQV